MSRVHAGCGTRNPYARTWMIWTAAAISWLLSELLVIFCHTLWGELGWLVLLLLAAPSVWWEFVHSPGKMYRTWWP